MNNAPEFQTKTDHYDVPLIKEEDMKKRSFLGRALFTTAVTVGAVLIIGKEIASEVWASDN